MGNGTDVDFVYDPWIDRLGIEVDRKKIRGSLKTACAKAEVPYVTHHSLRHFFANMLKEQKLDIGEISRFLGHANPTVTQNIYLHWRDEALHGRAQEVQILRPRIENW